VDPALNEMLEPIGFLLGTWRGSGTGIYPTIDDFSYEEEMVFTHTGRPFLVYSSKTWNPETAAPMHSESGFIRSIGNGKLEAVIAHAFGITEVSEGGVAGRRIELRATALTSAATAKEVDGVGRVLEIGDEALTYEIAMAFGGHDLQNHLKARLEKVS
jgi:hypothetical protein